MIRHLAFLTFAIALTSTRVNAQTTYTLKEPVDVHQSPTTSSPVIGRAARGQGVELTRDVGDWAEIVWTGAANRTGFMRVRLSRVPLTAFRDLPAIPTTVSPAGQSASSGTASSSRGPNAPGAVPDPQRADGLSPSTAQPTPVRQSASARDVLGYQLPAHTVGFGVRMDPRFRDFGGAARLWPHQRIGAQLEVVRSTATSDVSPGSLTTWQFSPAVLFALPDVVQSSIWIRPYAGTGLELLHSSFASITPEMNPNDRSFGTKIFGGAEMTMPGAPQVAVSVDVGYRWLESSFSAFELGGAHASIAAHWYMK